MNLVKYYSLIKVSKLLALKFQKLIVDVNNMLDIKPTCRKADLNPNEKYS